MSWFDFRERLSFIPVAGFQPRGFGSAYLTQRKGSVVARIYPRTPTDTYRPGVQLFQPDQHWPGKPSNTGS